MSKFASEEIPVEESADHLFWERASREGLIDAVGGTEWMRRMQGTETATDEWIRRHRVTVEAMENGTVTVDQLLDAVIEGALHPPAR